MFTYQYDNLNRQTHQILPAGSDVTQIVTSFDANNNVDLITEHKASAGSDITDHDYDLLDRLTTLTQRGMLVVAAALLSLPWLSRPALLGFATLAPCIYTWALAASGEGRTFCHFVPPPVPTAPPSFVQLSSISAVAPAGG